MTVGNKIQREEMTRQKEQVTEPPLFKVLLHNDDYTTMEFVVMVLETVFHKTSLEATRIMLNVHNSGVGIAGVFIRDVAETKAKLVTDLAQKYEHPLKCTIEKV